MQHYDVTIIGGGIAGAGVAQAAAAAGYNVLLLEKRKFATQTSSSSSKLIHGGLRYLESGQINLVYSALKERRALLNLAPDLVKPIPFYIPVYQNASRGKWLLRAGLFLYQCLCLGDNLSRFSELKKQDWPRLAGLKTDKLEHVFQYWDAQTDDHLLTLAVVQSAKALGAAAIENASLMSCQTLGNPSSAAIINNTNKSRHNGMNGYEIKYALNSEPDLIQTVHTSMIINAAGPWVNQVLARLDKNIVPCAIDWVQGTHIEIDVPALSHIYYIGSHLDDRVVFVMPWKGHTLVGTTENVLVDLPDNIEPTTREIEYLMAIFQHAFPDYKQNVPEIINVFAGVRVLPKAQSNAFNRQRESVVHQDVNHPKIISLYGGKLTTFRATSKKVIKLVNKELGPRTPRADIDTLILKPVESLI